MKWGEAGRQCLAGSQSAHSGALPQGASSASVHLWMPAKEPRKGHAS